MQVRGIGDDDELNNSVTVSVCFDEIVRNDVKNHKVKRDLFGSETLSSRI